MTSEKDYGRACALPDHREIDSMPVEFMNVAQMQEYLGHLIEENDRCIREILTRENGMIRLLEDLVYESDWRKIRAWLIVLNQYIDLMTGNDKQILLDQYYTMLIHPNGTVRRLVAANIGILLSRWEETDPEIWDRFLRRMLFVDNSLSDQEKGWIGYAIKGVLEQYLKEACPEDQKMILNTFVAYFKSTRWESQTCLSLIKAIKDIPYDQWSNLQRHYICGFIRQYMSREELEIRIASLRLIHGWIRQGLEFQDDMIQFLEGLTLQEDSPENERYLLLSIWQQIGYASGEEMNQSSRDSSLLIQKNLSFNTYGSDKVINLSILKGLSQTESEDSFSLSIYATHLLNVLRLNNDAEIFLPAGEDLVEVMPRLESHQKVEIVQEILKDVEMGIDSINYVPSFLGRTFYLLDMQSQKDILLRFEQLFHSGKIDIMRATLEVAEQILKHLPDYLLSHLEDEKEIGEEFRFFTGLFCRAMADYRPDLSTEAMRQMGSVFDHCHPLPDSYRGEMICLLRKTIAYLSRSYLYQKLPYEKERTLISTMRQAANLLAGYQDAEDRAPGKIAFFSGTFDPFSRSDRAIVKEIVEMGYLVYVYAHQFSWYKNTQPVGIRCQMIDMSIADIQDAYLFPQRYSINFNNPEELAQLREIFAGRELSLVMGSRGIENNEAYWREAGEDTIHAFPHILYRQGGSSEQLDRYTLRQIIKGDIIYLRMPSYYQKMDSDTVRKRVISGKEIDRYVSEQVCQMIVDWKLYKDRPAYKDEVMTRPIAMSHTISRPGENVLTLYDASNPDHRTECARITYREVRSTALYKECQDQGIVQALRKRVFGNIISIAAIDGTYLTDGQETLEDYRQIALNEMLAYVQKKGLGYAICLQGAAYKEMLTLQGFVPLEGYEDCYILDMTSPIALFSEVNLRLKAPFSRNLRLQKQIALGRKELLRALTRLYPGNLVLNFEMDILNYRMIQLIEEISHQFKDRESLTENDEKHQIRKECICVPFGKTLNRVQIPHMITKSLNTEKLYKSDLSSFDIREFADYPSLQSQLRTIRSFSKPIILIDDLYHKGNRMNKIQEILEEEQMEIDNIAVGVVTGRGHDLAQINHQKVNAVYTIPNLRCWFSESDLCPFIGGDGIETSLPQEEHRTILPSINTLLPYQMPSFLDDSSVKAVYDLSAFCLEHTARLYQILEEEYQKIYHRTLTLSRISDVVTVPRCPEVLLNQGDQDRRVTELLDMEMDRLRRMRPIIDVMKRG